MSAGPPPGRQGGTSEVRCKVCQLKERHPELWWLIHEKVVRERLAHTAVVAWANARIKLHNTSVSPEEQLVDFNSTNFSVHFSRHLPEDAIMLPQLTVIGRELGYEMKEDAFLNKVNVATGPDNVVLATYQNMQADIAYLREVLESYKIRCKASMEKGKPPSPQDLAAVQSTMSSIANLTGGMMKFFTAGGLARLAVQYALEAQGAAWIDSFNKGYGQSIAHKLPEDDLDLFRVAIVDNMEVALQEIHKELGRRFNLG